MVLSTNNVDSSLERRHTYDDSMISAAPELIQLKVICTYIYGLAILSIFGTSQVIQSLPDAIVTRIRRMVSW